MQSIFNKTTLMGKFIKQLVATFPTPIVSTWEPGQFVIAGSSYISKDYVLRALHNGTPRSYDDIGSFIDEKTQEKYSDYFFEKIEPYVFGYSYPGTTTTYISNTVDYDNTTHYYLGEYLRLLRIVRGIDLMPYYNCFGGKILNNIDFVQTDRGWRFRSSTKEGYKFAVVPVKYGKTYTIGLNYFGKVELMPCFFTGNKFLPQSSAAVANIEKESGGDFDTYKVVYNTNIAKPFIYKTPSWERLTTLATVDVGQFERYFTLLIKIPESIDTPISVVEGDVSDCNDGLMTTENAYIRTVVRNYAPSNAEEEYTPDYASPLSLFSTTLTRSKAFSDRLVEYLLLNVIDSADELSGNVKRVQDAIRELPNSAYAISNSVYGIWSDSMREFIYNFMMSNPNVSVPIDINGFVDKDTERYLV